MKKIAYIELDTHAEIAANFMDLMEDSKEFEVDFYLSEKILNLNAKNKNENIFLSDSSVILEQLSKKIYDLIIIGTAHRYFNVFQKIVEKYHTAILVHNLNFSKAAKSQLFKSVFKADVLYRLKLLMKESLLSASQVSKKANHLLILDENLETQEHQLFPIIYNKFNEKIENEVFTIVIPGAVSQKRRNYKHIFKVIKNLKPENKIQFIFLGKAGDYEFKELKVLQYFLDQNIEIQFFKEKVPQNIFDEWMQKADVLWCPIQEKTKFFNIKEIYGKTKITGNVIDAIKYGKPAIFPKHFSSNHSFIFHEENSFLNQIEKIKNQNFDFQKKFNKEKVSEKLKETLHQLILSF